MLAKIIIIVLLLIIIGSLTSGLVFMVRDKGHSNRTVKALTWRIALSLVAFALLMAGYFAGFIQPHGIYY
jgi:small neutral amino acid transporter SnatA (MarC family)